MRKILILILLASTVSPLPSKSQCLKADIVVLVDTSASLSGNEEKLQNAVAAFTDRFMLSDNTIRMGVIYFDSWITHVHELSSNKHSLQREVLKEIQPGGLTNMDRGITEAVKKLTADRNEYGVYKIIVLISDGQVSNPEGIKVLSLFAESEGVAICSVYVNPVGAYTTDDNSGQALLEDISTSCFVTTSYNQLLYDLENLSMCF